jgi:cholesterol transport system auxiliary component
MKAPLPHRRSVILAITALGSLLAGCGGLLPSPPERQIYRLAPKLDIAARPSRSNIQLVVATPTAPADLDTKRIALSRAPVTLDYYADAEWGDRPPFLLKAAVIEGFEKSRALGGVGAEGLALNADFVLNLDIRNFTAVYDSPNVPPLVRIRVRAQLVTMRGRNIVAETSLTGEARAAGAELPSIVAAFGQAAGMLVADLVTWTVANPALSPKRR